jgi:hypothetical protein
MIGTSEPARRRRHTVRAVELGHQDVEDHQRRPLARRRLEAGLAVARRQWLVAGAPQGEADDVPDVGIVVDQQDLLHAATLAAAPACRQAAPSLHRKSTTPAPPCTAAPHGRPQPGRLDDRPTAATTAPPRTRPLRAAYACTCERQPVARALPAGC